MKVRLDGEYYDFDGSRKPMSEALAVEKAWGKRYAEWESELEAGSAEAMCVLAWIIWRRAGKDIKLDDILSGEVDFDLAEMLNSITESQQQEAEAARPPTPAAGSGQDGTRTTRRATKRSLASTCIYGRGRFPC